MSSETVADWLIFGLLKKDRRGRDQWLKRQPIGLKVLREVLENAGAATGTCSAQVPHPNVVLVSLTSEHDLISFYQTVRQLPHWQPGKRMFRVIAGGYGMQNPEPIRDYVDYAYFGRAEDEITELLNDACENRPSSSISVLHLAERDHKLVKVRQARTMYDGLAYRETFTGCPLKCKFCHYTFARKHSGSDHAYSRSTGTAGSYTQATGHGNRAANASIEVTWPQLLKWPHEKYYADLTCAIDGPSEKVRWLYGKRISDKEIIDGLTTYYREASRYGLRGSLIKIYDIAGLPGETVEDREFLREIFSRVVTPKNFKALAMVHTTPFKPSAWTPMQWEGFCLDNFREKYQGRTIARWSPVDATRDDGSNWASSAFYSRYIESLGTQIMFAAAMRCDDSQEDRKAFDAVTLNPKFSALRSSLKLRAFRKNFPNVARKWLDQLEVGSPLPTQCAEPTVTHEKLASIAEKLRDDLGKDLLRGSRTIMGDLHIPLKPAPEVAAHAN